MGHRGSKKQHQRVEGWSEHRGPKRKVKLRAKKGGLPRGPKLGSGNEEGHWKRGMKGMNEKGRHKLNDNRSERLGSMDCREEKYEAQGAKRRKKVPEGKREEMNPSSRGPSRRPRIMSGGFRLSSTSRIILIF